MFLFKEAKSKVDNNLKTSTEKVEHKGVQYPQSQNGMNCKTCGKPLSAFRYYRDNICWTYCEECGKPHQACYAAPYRTIELMFSGIQREGACLTLEIKNWPSLEPSCLRWYEWSLGGGYEEKIGLPTNYISEHTVDEFINDYIKRPNKLIRHISNHNSEDFLNRSRIILQESGIFKQQTHAYTISYHEGRFRQLASKYKLLFCLKKENDNLSKLLNVKVQKRYEDMYAVYIDSENGTLVLSYAILIQLGATSTDRVEYAKVISFDEMKHLLLYELDFYKALVERWENEKDAQRANSCQEQVKELEIILNTKERDWKDLLNL